MKLKQPVLYHQQQYPLSMIIYDQYLHFKTLMTTGVIKEMQFAFLVYICTCCVVLHHVTLNKWCGSRKYTYPPQRWSLENPRRRRSQKPNLLRESMKQNRKFQGGGMGRYEQKNHPWGRYGYFLKPHILRNSENCECLNYCRIVDCLVTNHKKVQDMQANLKTAN